MDDNFAEIMPKRSNAELIEIVTKTSNDYQQEALDAAEKELENRNLTVDQVESAKQEIEIKQKLIKENANVPLGIGWKLLTFFIPGILNFFIARTLKAEGYERKWRDAWHWTFYGIAFYAIFTIFSLVLKF